MELWAPRILLPNMFSQKDIPNIRIQYVNQLFFHPNNSVLNTPTNTLVTEYSEVQNMIIFSLQIYYLCYCKVFKIFEYLFCRIECICQDYIRPTSYKSSNSQQCRFDRKFNTSVLLCEVCLVES